MTSGWKSQPPQAETFPLEDPWLRWVRQRPDGNERYQWLCEINPSAPALDAPALFRDEQWLVPSVYTAASRFFTASRSCSLGPPSLPKDLPPEYIRVECGNPVYRYPGAGVPQVGSMVSIAGDTNVVHGAGQGASRPTIAIIDSGLGFLHRQFRCSSTGHTRLLRYWDQGAGAVKGMWRIPLEFGYGRVLSSNNIDAKLEQLEAGLLNEAQCYADLDYSCANWSHGHHVLALAGAQVHPVTQEHDGAATCPLIAVQVPDAAFANTQGQWLKFYLLDALHFIMESAPRDAPVIVNISMGAHSGRHDGRGAIERAIEQLIDLHQGRLVLVIAAGNSRQVKAHAQVKLAPRQSADFALRMESGDISANFVEFWARTDDKAGRLKASLQGPDSLPRVDMDVPFLPLGTGDARWLVRDADAAYDQGVVALLCSGHVNRGPSAGQEAQLLLAIAQTDMGLGRTRPAATSGMWVLGLTNESDDVVAVDAWVGRDDDPGVAGDPVRNHKAFGEPTRSSLCVEDGSLSDLAWTSSAIVVGGYVASIDGRDAPRMYEASGAGWRTQQPLMGPLRGGPDLCAPALLLRAGREEGVGDVSCYSDPTRLNPPAPWRRWRCGTSLAAPQVTRRIANLLVESPQLRGRDAILAAIKATPGRPISPGGQIEWTSNYWLPL